VTSFLYRSLALAAVLLTARSASASIVVAKAGGDAHVSDVRIAHTTNATRTVTWEQLVLDEARGDLAWVVAVPRGGWLETGNDHWFESLDEATAAVIAPAKSLACAPLARESTAAYRAASAPRTIASGFTGLAPAAGIEKLTSLGFVVTPSVRAAILALDNVREDVAILTLPSGARGVTKVVRVLGPAGRALPMMLMPTGGALPRLTAYTFAEGRAKFAGLPAAEIESAKLAWSGGGSNYRDLLDDTIIAASPGVALTFAARDGVFSDQPGGAAMMTIPSLARRYFGAADSCVLRAESLSTSAKLVAPTCAKSTTFVGTSTPGCPVAGGEQLPATELTCGALDDLAVASGGLSPSRVVVTRIEGVAASFASGLAIELSALGSIPSYREAKLGPLCTESTGTPVSQPGPTTSTPSDTSATSSGDSVPSSSSTSSTGEGCATAAALADSCSRSSSSSNSGGGCGGDSSSDSDGCSGDSSSDSGGCSGASDSSDDGCSSSSSSSSGCSGASSSADDGCRAARVRPRIRFSAGVYALIALLAIARRFGRATKELRSNLRISEYDSAGRSCPEKISTDAPAHE
jgi:hypothetical protein